MNKIFKFSFIVCSLVISILASVVFSLGLTEAIKEGFSSRAELIKGGFALWAIFIAAFGGYFGAWISFKENKHYVSLFLWTFYLISIVLILVLKNEVLTDGWFYIVNILLLALNSASLIIGLFLVFFNRKTAKVSKGENKNEINN